MLVLSRKPGEKIMIGESITITVLRIGPNTVRLGIEAPRDTNIRREEIPAIEVDVELAADGTVQLDAEELIALVGVPAI